MLLGLAYYCYTTDGFSSFIPDDWIKRVFDVDVSACLLPYMYVM